MTNQTIQLIQQLSIRVSELETMSEECKGTLAAQQVCLERLSAAVEANQELFQETLAKTEQNGIQAYREVVAELRAELNTRMRWILIAVAIGAAIAGGTNLLPTLEMMP